MKTAKDYLDEANATVPRMSTEDAIALHAKGTHTFLDVRDSGDVAKSGTVAGAVRVPRGLIEFRADEGHPMHHEALTRDTPIAVLCALGGQAALVGKTLQDMGYTDVTNVGGFGAWKDAGGPTEDS